MSKEAAENLVQQGAILLDGYFGPTWVDRINLDKLDQDSPINCVVAQLDDHNVGWSVLVKRIIKTYSSDPTKTDPNRYGFDYHDSADFGELDDAWKKLILDRRNISPLKTKEQSKFVICLQDHGEHLDTCGPVFPSASIYPQIDAYELFDLNGEVARVPRSWVHELKGEYKLDLEFGDVLIFKSNTRSSVVDVRQEGSGKTVVDVLAKAGGYRTWTLDRLETEIAQVLRHPRKTS